MIISFGGKRGTGKTLAANYLANHYGFKKSSFADDLRRKMVYLWGMEPKHFTPQWKEKPYNAMKATPREMMIAFGQHMRYFDPEYWVKNVDLTGDRIAIDDMRFQNEAEYMKEHGATTVRLERYQKYNIYGKELNDPSETSLDSYKHDYKVEKVQNISKKDLFDYLDYIMKGLGIEHTRGKSKSLRN